MLGQTGPPQSNSTSYILAHCFKSTCVSMRSWASLSVYCNFHQPDPIHAPGHTLLLVGSKKHPGVLTTSQGHTLLLVGSEKHPGIRSNMQVIMALTEGAILFTMMIIYSFQCDI